MKGLCAENHRVEVEVVLLGGPAGVSHGAELGDQLLRSDAPVERHRVFAVGGEDHVTALQRGDRAHLGTLLTKRRNPESQLSLTLQGRGFGVEPTLQGHVPIEAAEVLVAERGDVGAVGLVLDEGPLGRK